MFDKIFNNKPKRNQESDAMNIYFTVFLSAITFLAHKQNSDPWEQLKNEIKNNNRYFPESIPIQEAIKSISNKAVYTLEKGEEIYRAQIISEVEMPQESQELFAVLTEIPQLADAFGLNEDVTKYLTNLIATGLIKQSVDPDKYKVDGFWGFNTKRSDAPPPNKAKAGRLNSSGIPCLYAAEEGHTAIVEVRPIIGQMVSVAKIEILKKLELFDFCTIPPFTTDDTSALHLLRVIAREFSKPNHDGEEGYLATQYVVEMIKNHFTENNRIIDGIRFPSSLHKGGVNIVLFDTNSSGVDDTYTPKNYCIKSTSLHFVKDITISEATVLPLKESKNE